MATVGTRSLEDSAYSVLRSMNRDCLLNDELQYELSARCLAVTVTFKICVNYSDR